MWCWACLMCALTAHIGATHKPHIVMIVADDLGWNDVGYHGSVIRTPNIDKLAGEGAKLESYYVQPICSPTRSQLMSGRYQIHTGLQHGVIKPEQPNGLPLELPTLADLLRAQGYATHAVGKWHLGFYKKQYTPTYRGFDSHFGYWVGAEDYFSHKRCETFHSGQKKQQSCGLDLRDNLDVAQNYTGRYSTHVFAERAVHAPLEVPKVYTDPYEGVITNKARRTFAGMVSCLDEAIGNISRTLQQQGLWDNTLLVFSTDNGGQVHAGGNNWPLRGNKDTLWEGGVRGVGFVHGHLLKSTRGGQVKELLHVSDWLPTLVRLAGGDVSNLTLDGLDAWQTISEGAPSQRKELLHNIDPLTPRRGELHPKSSFDNRVRAALRSGNWKLITGNPGEGEWFPPPDLLAAEAEVNATAISAPATNKTQNIWLFDISQDPLEKKDVSALYPDVVTDLLHKMANYNKTAVPCRYPEYDPRSNPGLHGGTWGPWED